MEARFITYLVCYAVDRIVTAIYNAADNDSNMRLESYKSLIEQADIIIEEFESKEVPE